MVNGHWACCYCTCHKFVFYFIQNYFLNSCCFYFSCLFWSNGPYWEVISLISIETDSYSEYGGFSILFGYIYFICAPSIACCQGLCWSNGDGAVNQGSKDEAYQKGELAQNIISVFDRVLNFFVKRCLLHVLLNLLEGCGCGEPFCQGPISSVHRLLHQVWLAVNWNVHFVYACQSKATFSNSFLVSSAAWHFRNMFKGIALLCYVVHNLHLSGDKIEG